MGDIVCKITTVGEPPSPAAPSLWPIPGLECTRRRLHQLSRTVPDGIVLSERPTLALLFLILKHCKQWSGMLQRVQHVRSTVGIGRVYYQTGKANV